VKDLLSFVEGFVAGAVAAGVVVTLVWRNNVKTLIAANTAMQAALGVLKKV